MLPSGCKDPGHGQDLWQGDLSCDGVDVHFKLVSTENARLPTNWPAKLVINRLADEDGRRIKQFVKKEFEFHCSMFMFTLVKDSDQTLPGKRYLALLPSISDHSKYCHTLLINDLDKDRRKYIHGYVPHDQTRFNVALGALSMVDKEHLFRDDVDEWVKFIEGDDDKKQTKKLSKKKEAKKQTDKNFIENKIKGIKPSKKGKVAENAPNANVANECKDRDDNLKKLIKEKKSQLKNSKDKLAETVKVKDEEISKFVATAEGNEKKGERKSKEIDSVRLKIREMNKLEEKLSEEHIRIEEENKSIIFRKDELKKFYEIKEADSKVKIAELEGDLDVLLKMLHRTDIKTSTDNPDRDQSSLEILPLLDYINQKIEDKERDLECPVCFEVAQAPIFMCEEQHVICSKCWDKVD